MFTFNLNEAPDALSSTNMHANFENGEDSLCPIPDDNSAKASGNSNLTWGPQVTHHFLTVMKKNYMSLKRDEGVTNLGEFCRGAQTDHPK